MPRYTPAFDGMDFDYCINALVDAVEMDLPDPATEDYLEGYKHAVHTLLGSLMQNPDQLKTLLERIFPEL